MKFGRRIIYLDKIVVKDYRDKYIDKDKPLKSNQDKIEPQDADLLKNDFIRVWRQLSDAYLTSSTPVRVQNIQNLWTLQDILRKDYFEIVGNDTELVQFVTNLAQEKFSKIINKDTSFLFLFKQNITNLGALLSFYNYYLDIPSHEFIESISKIVELFWDDPQIMSVNEDTENFQNIINFWGDNGEVILLKVITLLIQKYEPRDENAEVIDYLQQLNLFRKKKYGTLVKNMIDLYVSNYLFDDAIFCGDKGEQILEKFNVSKKFVQQYHIKWNKILNNKEMSLLKKFNGLLKCLMIFEKYRNQAQVPEIDDKPILKFLNENFKLLYDYELRVFFDNCKYVLPNLVNDVLQKQDAKFKKYGDDMCRLIVEGSNREQAMKVLYLFDKCSKSHSSFINKLLIPLLDKYNKNLDDTEKSSLYLLNIDEYKAIIDREPFRSLCFEFNADSIQELSKEIKDTNRKENKFYRLPAVSQMFRVVYGCTEITCSGVIMSVLNLFNEKDKYSVKEISQLANLGPKLAKRVVLILAKEELLQEINGEWGIKKCTKERIFINEFEKL
ncbi:hypothetical protein DAMA08_022510 [Martiniozyma asiatica (nom. inval.)]|nr:hypothetical protein DAMA08_022510 [Martiniozyma asiatica]